jgi:hypothetical protein
MYLHHVRKVAPAEVVEEAEATVLTIENMVIKTATIAAEIPVAAVADVIAPENHRPRKMVELDMTATLTVVEIKEVKLDVRVEADEVIIPVGIKTE